MRSEDTKVWYLSHTHNKVSKVAKIRNRYNQVPHLTQDTNGKVTNSQKTPQTRAKRSALSQQVKPPLHVNIHPDTSNRTRNLYFALACITCVCEKRRHESLVFITYAQKPPLHVNAVHPDVFIKTRDLYFWSDLHTLCI